MIVIAALADFVVSVKEVAAIVTVLPAGSVAGAVYVVVPPAPLVTDGLNEPQAGEPHVAVQMTPEPTGSFETCADNAFVVLTSSEMGGVTKKPTVMGTARIVRLALLLCDGLLVTAAVIVTVVPIGTADGAANTVGAPPAVCVGLNVPHAPFVMLPVCGFPPHITVQSTPALALSTDGDILNASFDPTESALAVAVTPFAEVITIGPALETVAEPPQPERTTLRAIQLRNTALMFAAHLNGVSRFQRTSTGRNDPVDTKEIMNGVLFVFARIRRGLRLSV